MFCPGPGPIATEVAHSLTMVGGDVLPEGVALENHEKSVLMAMKTELLEVKEHMNSLLSKVDSCLGLSLGSYSFGSLSPSSHSELVVKESVDKGLVVKRGGVKEKALVGDGPKTYSRLVWWSIILLAHVVGQKFPALHLIVALGP